MAEHEVVAPYGATTDGEMSAPDVGVVRREDAELVIDPPAQMPVRARRVLTVRLQTYAAGSPGFQGSIRCPVHAADRVREQLAEPWPAGQWTWMWTHSAAEAADSAGARAG